MSSATATGNNSAASVASGGALGQSQAQPSPSYPQRTSAFPFGAANQASRNPNNSASGQPLDLNDFPALGGQQGGPFASSNQNQNLTASGLLSSYASQAGVTGLSGSNAIGGGMGGAPGLTRQPPGSFSTDDFPALGAPNGNASNQNQNLSRNPNNQPPTNSAPGSNQIQNQPPGMGGAAGGIASNLQEQASAAAALQHQHLAREAHRQSLLGSMSSGLSNNGSSGSQSNQMSSNSSSQPSTNNGAATQMNAARGGFGEPERVS